MTARMHTLLLKPLTQAALAATVALAVYVRTLAPTVMWYDMGEFATAAYVLGIAHNTGYPLFMLLGKLFTFLPVGNIAYRVNLMSAFFAALTVLVIYLIVFRLTERRAAAMAAALTMAFTSTLWSNATWAESYDLNAFLTVLILYLLLRWMRSGRRNYLYAASLVFGLGLGNHHLILVVAPAGAYLIWRSLRTAEGWPGWRPWAALGLIFLAGFSVNLYLPLRAARNPAVNWGDPSSLKSFLTMITTGYANAETFINPFGSVENVRFWWRTLSVFPPYEFTAAGLLLAALGAVFLFRKDRPFFLATAIVVSFTAGMISIYGIHNIFNYFEPMYLMIGIWLGCGASQALASVEKGGRGGRFKWLTSGGRGFLAALLILVIPFLLLGRNFRILDRSGDRNAADFAAYVLSHLEEGSIVLTDFWSWTPLLYAQVVEGKGDAILVSPALSLPGVDQDKLLTELLGSGDTVYIAVGVEDSPRLNIGEHELQLYAPFIVHYYPTHAVPLPAFKDLLVPKGAVYKVLAGPPKMVVEKVPSGDQLQVRYEGGLSLVGFHIDRSRAAPGEVLRSTFYWEVAEESEVDYWADILFTDGQGNVATKGGIPIWLQSHWIGGGAYPISEWKPGEIVGESYDGLIPRSVNPGTYYIRIYIYQDSRREKPVLPADPSSREAGVLLGSVTVEAR